MKKTCLMAILLLVAAGGARAGVAVGDRAPGFQGKEFIGIEPISMKHLAGKVVLYEIFRTW